MAALKHGTYSIKWKRSEFAITDPLHTKYLMLLRTGALPPGLDKVTIKYKKDKGAYSLKFVHSGKFITYEAEPKMDKRIVTGDEACYFTITELEDNKELFIIGVAEDKQISVGLALEEVHTRQIFMLDNEEKQAWFFVEDETAML